MTSQDYYSSPKNWGSGLTYSLKDVVNDYMEGLADDDPTVDDSILKIIRSAKRAIRKFRFVNKRDLQKIELDLSPNLMITLPQDYVDYVKISWVDDKGILYPMSINSNISVAKAFLQDDNYELLMDSDGSILSIQGKRPKSSDSYRAANGFNEDLGNVYQNGSFNIDEEAGVIQFDSKAKEKTVVLHYISDGITNLSDSKIKVHKFAIDAVNNFIFYDLIKRRKNITDREKRRARRDLILSEKLMRAMLKPVRFEDIMQVLKSKTRWLKQ